MFFNNYEYINHKVFKSLIPKFKEFLKPYNLPKNSIVSVFYKEETKSIHLYLSLDCFISKHFKFEMYQGSYTPIPKNKKLLKELDTKEKLQFYYNYFEKELEAKYIFPEIYFPLYRGLKPDYFEYDSAIYELDTKENTIKKLKKEMALYKKTIEALKC